MPAHGFSSKSEKNEAAKPQRRDPYEVLGVSRNSTDQEIKSAYRKMALKYHPDKNANDPKAADMFKEATFSYNILSDPDKRRQYDTAGFEAIESESQDLELDLSSLGAVNTMFAALFSKLGVPIKTTVSATVLEEALNGNVSVRELQLGQPILKKVEKQSAHFYSVTITEQEAQAGFVCRVQSPDKSKFKLLYFEPEENNGLSLALQISILLKTLNKVRSVHKWSRGEYICCFVGLASPFFPLQESCGLEHLPVHSLAELLLSELEDSAKTGKVTSAGMYFLGFPVYRLDQTLNSMAAAKDPDAAFFRKLDGFQPCEITELKAGTHVFAVYGDNFFKSASYRIEALCAAPFSEEKGKLRAVETQILTKRVELSKFETEYREVLAQFTEMTSRYAQEMQAIDELLKQRNVIHASYSTAPPLKRCSSSSKVRGSFKEESKGEEDCQAKDKKPMMRDRTKKKKWFNIHLKVDKRKPC